MMFDLRVFSWSYWIVMKSFLLLFVCYSLTHLFSFRSVCVMLLLLCCCYWISFGYTVWMLSKIYGRAEWRAGAWNFRSARMFALYFVLIPMITILFFVAHKACWFFQFLLNYFDTLNISFLFVFFSVVYFIMFQLTITWFCLRYDFMFTKMF